MSTKIEQVYETYRGAKGVIHIGASRGQERQMYDSYGLNVIWIEALPDVYAELSTNIAEFPKQIALNALITDTIGTPTDFYVTNNGGLCSSIYDLHLHQEYAPNTRVSEVITLSSNTLDNLLSNIDVSLYDILALDVHGAEILVLSGASKILESCKYVIAEASDFEAYKGGCDIKDVSKFLYQRGFFETGRYYVYLGPKKVGSFFDVVYKNHLFDDETQS